MNADNRGSVERLQEKPQHLHYLNDFRVEACPLFKQHQCQQHRPYTCFNWHFANQRRRRPVRKPDGSFNYSPDIYCDKYDENTGICPDGDDCVYLHRVSGDVERKYHLRYYKTAQCVHSTDTRGQCVKNGAHCAFAHSATDLRLPQFDQHEAGFATSLEGEGRDRTSFVIEDQSWHNHVLSCYKTEQCRKPARLCRQGYACPFYHNSKDRRRPPALFKYRSTPCPAAKTVDEWLDPELCEAGDNCQYCHTRTEQQFHPEIYKSTKCNDMLEHGYCPRAVFCAFAHHDTELHVQRTPYLSSAQPSPNEQCSPNANSNGIEHHISDDSLRFGSPSTNGSTPTYSAVLKQRSHPVKQYSTNSELLCSSYPKAPGFERGPLSPNRAESALGRLRTHSLNMGHIDMSARNEFTGFNPGTSLPSHSSLCRSDSGFHAVAGDSLAGTLEELSLDLEPIAENSRLNDLFGSQTLSYGQLQMTSPVRIPGADSFHTSPMTSFGENIFNQSKQPLASPQGNFNGFEQCPTDLYDFVDNMSIQGDKEMEDLHRSIEARSSQHKIASWEETMKQARQACEAWRADAQHYKMKAEQMEMERNRAIFERDQVVQQLEALKMHFANSMNISGDSPLGINGPAAPPASTPDMSDLLSAATNTYPPGASGFNMFAPDVDPMAPGCARCGRDRSRSEGRNGCPLCSS